jgi:SAM-dependent methyltransferase
MTAPFFLEWFLDNEPDPAGRQVVQLIEGIFTTPVTVAIAQLGIPSALADKSLTGAEVAAEAGTDPGATDRLLRAGVAVGLLTADTDGRYALTDMGRWLRPDVSSLGEMAWFWQAPMVGSLLGLADHVREGRTVDPTAPGGVWEYFGTHPEDAVEFSRAMGYVTTRVLAGLAAAGYRPPDGKRIVDVGGNRGTLLAWLLKAVPEATGVVIDLPGSLAAAPGYLAAEGVADRTELVPGSFLAGVPAGDVHVVSNVLHNWDDASVRLLAANCARSAPPGGWLVVIEPAFPTVPAPAMGPLMDMLMMVLMGGSERTRESLQALIEPAGYTFAREISLPLWNSGSHAWRVLEFRRL